MRRHPADAAAIRYLHAKGFTLRALATMGAEARVAAYVYAAWDCPSLSSFLPIHP